MVVHVDDFLASGEQDQLDWFKHVLMETIDLSRTTIGPESNDEHKVKYVNRILRSTPKNMISCDKAFPVIAERMGLGRSKRGNRANNHKFGRQNRER